MKASQFDIERLKGRPVWDLFPALLENHKDICEIRVQTYRPAPKLSERLHAILSDRDQELLSRVDEMRRATGVPFWDVLLGLSMREGKLDGPIAQSALLHDLEQKADTFRMEPSALTSDTLARLNASIPQEEGLVLCSKVSLKDGDPKHIPMVDFRCPPTPGNARAIQMFVAKANLKRAFLIESGNSYHLYGTSLLTQDEWVRFMAICLLFAPVTDPRYIAHRLADGECRLKIVAHDGKVPKISGLLYA